MGTNWEREGKTTAIAGRRGAPHSAASIVWPRLTIIVIIDEAANSRFRSENSEKNTKNNFE